jgi:CheY-like chemotaxis protein
MPLPVAQKNARPPAKHFKGIAAMTNKTRVLHVRVVGFSPQERQMLNSIFLLSVAPARQIGYKLWAAESGVAPDMYLLDGDSDSAVASWQATFASTSERTLVVGSKNTSLGVAAAARPLGLKVVGAMDRLAIALKNAAEFVSPDMSEPPHVPESRSAGSRANGTLPTSAVESMPTPIKQNVPIPRAATGMSASLNTAVSAAGPAMSATPSVQAAMPSAMTAAAPATTVLPAMSIQPNVAPQFERSMNERTVTDKTVDRILNDKPERVEKPVEKPLEKLEKVADKMAAAASSLQMSGVTPLSPSALSAAVAPSTSSTRTNLRVVPSQSPLAASIPAARSAEPDAAPPIAAATPAVAPAWPVASTPTAPVAVAPIPPPVVMPPVAPVAPAAAPTPRHEEHNFRVLAVDDSPLMRTFLNNKLQPYGIQPEFASSGEEALFKISKQHFDMIFLDVMLPGMDGYDVCKMIKKNKDNSLMKVVMLTSKDKTFDKIRGTMAGCDGYLTKPVDEMKLRAIIERHTVTRK